MANRNLRKAVIRTRGRRCILEEAEIATGGENTGGEQSSGSITVGAESEWFHIFLDFVAVRS